MDNFDLLLNKLNQKHMEYFKNFWISLKEWYADPITKNTADDIINWLDDYVENPKKTVQKFESMDKRFKEETK